MNLIYVCVFYNEKYIRLLELLLLSLRVYSMPSYDLLVLTSDSFKDKIASLSSRIGLSCKIHCLPCTSIFEAACARLHLFDWPGISAYEKILYLDTDIIIRRDVGKLFENRLDTKLYGIGSGTLESPQFGGQFFKWPISGLDHRTPGVNSGTLLFLNCEEIRSLFDKINDHIKTHLVEGNPIPVVMDQPFINYHAFLSGRADTQLLAKDVSLYEDMAVVENEGTASICHFSFPIGNFEHKYQRMSTFFSKLLSTKISDRTSMDLIGKKFVWAAGFIKCIKNHNGFYEVRTSWGTGSFHILDQNRILAFWNNHYHVLTFNAECTEYFSIRTHPQDFDSIGGKVDESFIHIYGDSHAMLSLRDLPLEHRNLFEFAKTMHRVGRDTEIIHFRPSHTHTDRIFCFAYGEVDARAHIGNQVRKGRSYQTICKDLVTGYIRTIRTLITTYKAILILAVSPPTKLSDFDPSHIDQEKREGLIPFVGTDTERITYTLELNRLLEEACAENGFTFFDPYDPYRRADGTLNYELSDSCIHVGKNEYILTKFTECISRLT